MDEITQQWRADGSGSGHMQTVASTPTLRLQAAERAFMDHTVECDDECASGTDCAAAAKLRETWRAAKAGATQ